MVSRDQIQGATGEMLEASVSHPEDYLRINTVGEALDYSPSHAVIASLAVFTLLDQSEPLLRSAFFPHPGMDLLSASRIRRHFADEILNYQPPYNPKTGAAAAESMVKVVEGMRETARYTADHAGFKILGTLSLNSFRAAPYARAIATHPREVVDLTVMNLPPLFDDSGLAGPGMSLLTSEALTRMRREHAETEANTQEFLKSWSDRLNNPTDPYSIGKPGMENTSYAIAISMLRKLFLPKQQMPTAYSEHLFGQLQH